MCKGIAATYAGEQTAKMAITIAASERDRLTKIACQQNISVAELLRRAVLQAHPKQDN